MRRVTADTNILVSALMFGGKPLTVLDMAQAGEIELALSDAILNETLRILRDKFHRTSEQLLEIESHLRSITGHVQPTERIDVVTSDPDDNRVLECAVAAGSDTVVSGDSDLLQLGRFRGIEIQKASEFLAKFRSGSQ